MTADVNHVFLTRFNLPSRGAESYIRAREGWLQDRMRLFEQFTVPSMRSQTAENVAWVVYLDPESPDWLKDGMRDLAGEGLLLPVYREEVSREELLADIEAAVGSRASWLVTTNLDNDDGLASDFSARVQSAAIGASSRVIYLDRGLILAAARLYLRTDRHNAFCSVADRWDDPRTCWSAWHTELDQHMPASHLGGQPGWLQVIHGNNVSNRVRGQLVDPEPYVQRFGECMGHLPKPAARDQMRDVIVGRPRRAGRELARGGAKRLLLALGGRRGMETVHERWNAIRARWRQQPS